jgi:hypothetical protein
MAVAAALNATAQTAGTIYAQYRANGVDNPTAAANQVGTIQAWLTPDPTLKTAKQNQAGKPDWYGAFDPTYCDVGDYLIGPDGTFFVIATQFFKAPHLIQCNHVLSIARASDTLEAGSGGVYSGDAINTATAFMSGWPASMLQLSSGSKMGQTGMSLPSDGKTPGVAIWLPVTAPEIRFNDIITDENSVRYSISSVELTPLGYRIVAETWPSA